MAPLGRLLDWIAARATLLLASGVLLGLAIQPVAALMRPWLTPIIVLNIVVALLRLELSEVLAYGRRPWLAGLCVLLALLVTPLLLWLVLTPLGLPEGTRMGLILMAAAPPVMAAPAFALILGLDAAYAILVVLITHAIVPFTLPFMALWLLGLELEVSAAELMGRLLLVVGSAFAISLALRRWVFAPETLRRQSRRLDAIAVIGLVLFSVAIMDGVTGTMLARPEFVLVTTLAAFAVNASLQVLGSLAFLGFGRRVAFTVGLMTGNRNMGLVLASLGPAAPLDVAVFFAIGQLPMYMLPAVALPIYRRLLRKP